jgi:regulator of sigma E protease
MSSILLILGVVLFIGLVIVHEFGHFIMARRGGVDIEEFGLFFPPRIYKQRIHSPKGDYDFTINLLPLGGFVRLKGENDSDKTKGSYGAAPLPTKIKIMLAGVTMNLLTAFVILSILALVGMPRLIDNQFSVPRDTHVTKQQVLIGAVESDSPAAAAGLKQQDHLTALGAVGAPQPVTTADDLPNITKHLAGQQVTIEFTRAGRAVTAQTTLRTKQAVDASKNSDNPKGYLGIVPTEYVVQRSTWSAPIVALGFMKQVTVLTFQGLGHALSSLFRGNTAEASSQVSGPVGIFVLLRDGSLLGYQFILMIIAIISLTLAIMNVLPIPALDGGRLAVTLGFRAARIPLKKHTEELIHGIGFLALMTLFVLITIVDVKRFF